MATEREVTIKKVCQEKKKVLWFYSLKTSSPFDFYSYLGLYASSSNQCQDTRTRDKANRKELLHYVRN